MHFLLVLWLSQHPELVGTEQGSHQLVLAALALTHDHTQVLTAYERSLLDRMGRREMTLPHVLAYLQEFEQA